jgi:hypothetical protein
VTMEVKSLIFDGMQNRAVHGRIRPSAQLSRRLESTCIRLALYQDRASHLRCNGSLMERLVDMRRFGVTKRAKSPLLYLPSAFWLCGDLAYSTAKSPSLTRLLVD